MPSASLLVLGTVFIDLIGFGIVLPLLPSYAAAYHTSEATIGLLVASFSAMQFVFAPMWGRLSDRIGRRPVLLVGMAGSTLSYLLFAMAGSFWVLLASRVVAGGMGATVNVAQAYLADLSTPERRARMMGMLGAAFGLGFVVGPAIGGVSSRWGAAAPGLVACALSGTNLLVAWFWLPESRRAPPSGAPPAAVQWTRLIGPFGAVMGSTIAFTVMYVVFPLAVERVLGLDRHHTAYLFVLIGIVSATVQGGLVGRLVPRVGERAMLVGGGILLATGMVLLSRVFGPLRAEGLLYPGLILLSIGSAMIGPSAAALVSRLSPEEQQGRALGMLQGVGALSRVVGPVLAGAVAGAAGPRAAFLVAGGLAGLAGAAGLLQPGAGGDLI